MIHASRLTRAVPGRQGDRSRPCAASTSMSRRASSSPSSARTAQGSRRACGCSRRCCAPTSGSATVAGHDVDRGSGRASGARSATSARAMAPRTTSASATSCVTQGRAYGLSGREAGSGPTSSSSSLELGEVAKRTAGTLSGGQRRRLDIAIGMVHRAAPAVPRRAVDRPRPAEPGEPVGPPRPPSRARTTRRSS